MGKFLGENILKNLYNGLWWNFYELDIFFLWFVWTHFSQYLSLRRNTSPKDQFLMNIAQFSKGLKRVFNWKFTFKISKYKAKSRLFNLNTKMMEQRNRGRVTRTMFPIYALKNSVSTICVHISCILLFNWKERSGIQSVRCFVIAKIMEN